MSVQGEKLKAIADAIRAKKGSSEPIKASDFASEILSIQAGIEPSGTIEISENGVYNVAEYAEANVNVSGGGGGKLAEFMSGTFTEITAEDMEGATAIKSYAVYNDATIEKFHTGNTATSIEMNAVAGNANLKEITIGENVTTMGNAAFTSNYYLEKVIYNANALNGDSNEKYYFRYNGRNSGHLLCEINSKRVVAFLFGKSKSGTDYHVTDVIINGRDGECKLNYGVFQYCPTIKNVHINCETLYTNDTSAVPFRETGKDTAPYNIYLSPNVKNIGLIDGGTGNGAVFRNARYINSVDFGNVENICDYAFYSCYFYSGIIELPATLKHLGTQTFYGARNLTKVIFRGQSPNILSNAFYGCPVTLYDFRNCTTVPTLASTNSLGYGAGCQIVIPDALYDEWTTATNWSALPTDTTASEYVVWVHASEYVEV